MSHVLFGIMLIGVVPAPGKHCQLSIGKMTIERDSLLNLEERTSVRIQNEGGAVHQRQSGPQIKYSAAVGPPANSCQFVEWLGPVRPVPADHVVAYSLVKFLKC